MQETEDLLSNELEVTDTVKNHLADVAGWARFLAVTGLVFCTLMLAASFYAAFYISRIMAQRYGFSIGPAIAAVYIFFSAVLLFPCLFLYRFSVTLQEAVKNDVQDNFEIAFLNLRAVFRFLGIVIIIILMLWLLSFLVLVIKTI